MTEIPELKVTPDRYLTYRYAGRDFRLTDVAGSIAKEIFA